MAKHRRLLLTLSLLSATVGTVAAIRGGGASAAPDCPSPLPPTLTVDGYPGGEEVPPLPGRDVATPIPYPVAAAPIDSDGDGTDDDLTTSEPTPAGQVEVSVARGDGTVRFARAGAWVTVTGDAPGDLDGDGRDELMIVVLTPTTSGPGTGPEAEGERYVVPGTVDPGTHDPRAVGIRIPTGRLLPIGDRTGDGRPDLLQITSPYEPDPVTRVLSPPAIVAAGVGVDARASATAWEAPGLAVAFADLGGPVTAIVTTEFVDAVVLTRIVAADGSTQILTSPGGYILGNGSTTGAIQLYVSEQGRYLVESSGSRSGSTSWVWRIDEPCGRLPATATTTTTTLLPGVDVGAGSACGAPLPPSTTGAADQLSSEIPPGGGSGPNAAWEPGQLPGDLDGDGRGDPPSIDGDPVATRYETSAGDVTFAVAGADVHPYQSGQFDLDGDGREDVLLEVGSEVLGEGGTVYAVPGSVGPGRHDPAVVGVRLPASWSTDGIRNVGDQDADGRTDLAVGLHDLYSGGDLLDPGAGGEATPQPFLTLPGTLSLRTDGTSLVADLGDGRPTLLSVEQVDATTIQITVGLDGRRLTTADQAITEPFDPENPALYVVRDPMGPIVSLVQDAAGADSAAVVYWTWLLDQPCDPSGPGDPNPATPVPGRPTFTG